MPQFIDKPTIVEAAGNLPKEIREYFGRVNSGSTDVSIAHMVSPKGWTEPAQTPEFDEYTIVLDGSLTVETDEGTRTLNPGQGVLIRGGEKVRYSTPDGGASYIAVCLPAFSPDTVHRHE